jgi:hypothetical protein
MWREDLKEDRLEMPFSASMSSLHLVGQYESVKLWVFGYSAEIVDSNGAARKGGSDSWPQKK